MALGRIGRYELVREIGRGGMGVVYRAVDTEIGRVTAIKTLHGDPNATAEDKRALRDRLRREAQAVGVLSHPNIITLFDVGQHDDTAYIVMEYVEGQSLEQRLGQGPLPPEEALDVLRQVAAALDYAHRRGVVHRDIKPGNILLREGEGAKVADFGVAKVTASSTLTQVGTVVGSPNYMAPEQLTGKLVTGRSDQFALAVLTYELFTRRRPFQGDTLPSLVAQILFSEPDLSGLAEAPDSPFTAALRRALAKEPDQRFATCGAFVASLGLPGGTVLTADPAPARGTGIVSTTALALVVPSRPAGEPEDTGAVALRSRVAVAFAGPGDALHVGSGWRMLRLPLHADEGICPAHVWHQAVTEEEPAVRVAVSPDGVFLATTGHGGAVRFGPAEVPATARTLAGHQGPVQALAFGPDGRWLASAGADGAVRLWRTETGATACVLSGHAELVGTVAFSPDNRLVAEGGSDGMVRLWYAASGAQGRAMGGHECVIRGTAFSPDGKLLATAADTVRLWHVATGRAMPLAVPPGSRRWGPLAFTADGQWLVATRQVCERLEGGFQVTRGELVLFPLTGATRGGTVLSSAHEHGIHSLGVHPTRAVAVTGGEDGRVLVWDLPAGRARAGACVL